LASSILTDTHENENGVKKTAKIWKHMHLQRRKLAD